MPLPLIGKPLPLIGKRLFPCPICGEGLEVRESKKEKPYVVCNRDGVQMFVRTQPGIRNFEKLVADAEANNVWDRLRTLEGKYKRKCPKCGKGFWVNDKLIETSWFDGRVLGYKCPEPNCDGVAQLEE
jgi:predicted RNA-binding Zn-ribbon protein involved in translation (DUF1610 family)